MVVREPVNVKIACKRTMPQRAASKLQNTLNRSQEQHTKNAGAKRSKNAEMTKKTQQEQPHWQNGQKTQQREPMRAP